MNVRNTEFSYGIVSIALHWAIAFSVIGLFASGLWMVDLGYYDPWYHQAPALHKAIGVIAAVLMLVRLAWRWGDGVPEPEPRLRRWEARAAQFVHAVLSVGVVLSIISGYLIATAKGEAVDVFGLFSVPATIHGLPRQADVAGDIHFYVGLALIGFASLHALAAFKHHFIDRDATLVRMLGLKPDDRARRS